MSSSMNEGANRHLTRCFLRCFTNDYVAGTVVQAFSMIHEDEFEINHPFVYTIIKASSNEETGVRKVTSIFFGYIVDPIADIE